MNTKFAKLHIAAALILSCASLSAMAGDGSGKHLSLLGDAAPATAAERTININANTRYVNVVDGETVRFVAANGQSSTWTFDNPNRSEVKLRKIMPAGSLDHKVMAYVSPTVIGDEPNS